MAILLLGEATPRSEKMAASRRHVVRMWRSCNRLQYEVTGVCEEPDRPKKSLLWWFKVIRAICRLALDMKTLSMKRSETGMSWQTYYQHSTKPTPKNDGGLSLFFDKREYSRTRGSQVPWWARAITIKSPQARTEEELHRLDGLLMRIRVYRNKFDKAMRKEICRVARYTNCEKGRVVVRHGHLGLNFYLVFSGSLRAEIERVDPKTGVKGVETENWIRSGHYFGELALLGDGKRSASVTCQEPTELFHIDKGNFLVICPRMFDAELKMKLRFVKKIELFHSWDVDNLKKLSFQSRELYFAPGKIIESDWSSAQFIYFVLQGKISLYRDFDLSKTREGVDDPLLGMMGRKLEMRGSNSRCLVTVGALHAGDHSELCTLVNCGDPTRVTMLSDGAKVLRVTTKSIRTLAPQGAVDKYMEQKYAPTKFPSDDDLRKKYAEALNWRLFRERILATVLLQMDGAPLAFIPATRKGSSGWARWPGSTSSPPHPPHLGRTGLVQRRSPTFDIPNVLF